MSLPRDLRRFEIIDPPKYKKDWEGCLVRAEHMPGRREYDTTTHERVTRPETLVPDGAVLTLRKRYTRGDGNAALVCDWPCPCCGYKHEREFTETDVAQGGLPGRLHFVREEGIAQGGPEIIYLASPYSHPDAQVRQERWLAAADAAAWIMNGGEAIWDIGRGYVVFSPIAMGHPISVMGAHTGLGYDFAAWQRSSLALLDTATVLVMLEIPGAVASVGMKAELDYARKRGMPVYTLRPKGDSYSISASWQPGAAE